MFSGATCLRLFHGLFLQPRAVQGDCQLHPENDRSSHRSCDLKPDVAEAVRTYIYTNYRQVSNIKKAYTSWWRHQMIKIFRVTGHLCGEFTGPRWAPRPKASDAERPLWRHCNGFSLMKCFSDCVIYFTDTSRPDDVLRILGLHPPNKRRHYKVTPSLSGWTQTWNQPSRINRSMTYVVHLNRHWTDIWLLHLDICKFSICRHALYGIEIYRKMHKRYFSPLGSPMYTNIRIQYVSMIPIDGTKILWKKIVCWRPSTNTHQGFFYWPGLQSQHG